MSSDEAQSSLGERLLAGVTNLWKVSKQHGTDIEEIRRRLNDLEGQVHSLKTSRGIARARNARLEQTLAQAESKLADIRSTLN